MDTEDSPGAGASNAHVWIRARNVVSPYLWYRGIKRLRRWQSAISFGSLWRAAGGAEKLRRRNYGWGGFHRTCGRKCSSGRGVRDEVALVADGRGVKLGGVEFEALAPGEDVPERAASNNESLVLRAALAACALLTGDIEKIVERQLVDSGSGWAHRF